MRKHPGRFIGIGLLLYAIGIIFNVAWDFLAMIERLPDVSDTVVRKIIPYMADNAVRLFGLSGIVIFVFIKYLNKKSSTYCGTVLTVVSAGAIVMYFWRMFIQCYKIHMWVADDVIIGSGSSLIDFLADNSPLEVIGAIIILLGSIGMLLKKEEEVVL